jgi:hypothetical protein
MLVSENKVSKFATMRESAEGCDAMRRKEAPAFMLADAEGRYTKPALV